MTLPGVMPCLVGEKTVHRRGKDSGFPGETGPEEGKRLQVPWGNRSSFKSDGALHSPQLFGNPSKIGCAI